MIDSTVRTNYVKEQLNKKRAYRHIRQHTPTRSLTSSNSLLTTCMPEMAETFKTIPVVRCFTINKINPYFRNISSAVNLTLKKTFPKDKSIRK